MRLAIDFGTTNSVVACRHDDGAPIDMLPVPGLSQPADDVHPPLVPSLLYVVDGAVGQTIAGQAVRDGAYDHRPDHRLFRNFKRGIVASPAPPPRAIDGAPWADLDAGERFLRHLLDALPYDTCVIDQLTLTAPVVAFDAYHAWLTRVLGDIAPRVRLVDESTAAALGYAVTAPGALVLVFDFGGGTLDLTLAQLPESNARTGGFLDRLRYPRQQTARVIAKAGRVLGGSDVDQWLLAEVLRRANLTPQTVGSDYASLLTRCEQAKIALSSADRVTLDVRGRDLELTRDDLEAALRQNQFFAALRHVIDKVMRVARQEGIFKEDIDAVLLVGGASLMPAAQDTLRQYFGDGLIRAHKPFTAVVEGALQADMGLDDYLLHSYGLRHLDADGARAYEELIPAGTRYPTREPFEIVLGASRADQREVEFVIAEIATDSVSLVDTHYENGQVVFVAKADENAQQIQPLNLDAPTLAHLNPGGEVGEDRLRAAFMVDTQRQLRVTVRDLRARKTILRDQAVVTLR